MSDFPDDPSAIAARKAYLERSEGAPQSSTIEGKLGVKFSRDALQNELTWQPQDTERVRQFTEQVFLKLQDLSLRDFTSGLKAFLESQPLDLPDGSLVIFLKNEIKEAIAHALSRAGRRREITKEALENLHEVLSCAHLEVLLDEFGINFISMMNQDILNGLSFSEQIETFDLLLDFPGIAKENAEKVRDDIYFELRTSDPITAIFASIEQSLKTIDKEFTALFEDLVEGKPRRAPGHISKISSAAREAKAKISHGEIQAKRFYKFLFFLIIFGSFKLLGTSTNLALCLSVGFVAIGASLYRSK